MPRRAATLKTPREVKRAVRYLLTNYRHHALESLPAPLRRSRRASSHRCLASA
ncbi:MAG TPA: hypothetical protein VFL36_19865 [Myxococcales bacterium]|nr:hypothetical protein [Myxococcales bacterium]